VASAVALAGSVVAAVLLPSRPRAPEVSATDAAPAAGGGPEEVEDQAYAV